MKFRKIVALLTFFFVISVSIQSGQAFAADTYDKALKVVYQILKPVEKHRKSHGGLNRIRLMARRLQTLRDIRFKNISSDEKERELHALIDQLKRDRDDLNHQEKSAHNSIATHDLMTQVDEAFKKDQFALRMAHMQEHMEKGLYDPENSPESPMPGIHYQIREFLARVKDRVGKVKSVGANVTVDEFVIAGIGGGAAAGVLQTSLGRRFAVVVAQVTGTIGVGAQIMGGWYEFDVKTHKLIGFASGGGAATGGIGDNHSGVSGGLLVAGLTVDRGGNTNIIEGGVSTLHVAKEIGFMPVKLLPMLPKHRGIRQHGKYDFIKEQLGLI